MAVARMSTTVDMHFIIKDLGVTVSPTLVANLFQQSKSLKEHLGYEVGNISSFKASYDTEYILEIYRVIKAIVPP